MDDQFLMLEDNLITMIFKKNIIKIWFVLALIKYNFYYRIIMFDFLSIHVFFLLLMQFIHLFNFFY